MRQNGLSKPCKTSLTLGLLWWDQLFDILVMVEGGELMLSLVIRDGFLALNDDIFLKRTLTFIASRCTNMAPLSNSFDSMHMVILGATRLTICWCIMSTLLSKHVLVVVNINLSKYLFRSSWTCFLSLPRWVCQIGGITCIRRMKCMFMNFIACDRHHFSPSILYASFWDGSITCMGIVSFICACCAPCCTYSFYNSFSHLCSSCSSLSFCLSTWNSFSISFSTFTWSSCRVVTS